MTSSLLSRQSGVFSILGAVTLSLALISLVLALDSGRLYMEQRKLQKLADTAALETVARLDEPRCFNNPIADVTKLAKENAELNGFSPEMMTAECVSVISENGINETEVNPAGYAVQTTASETVPASLILRTGHLFGFDFAPNIRLQAKAVAERSSEPTAVFSSGAQLLRLNNNKLIANLLKGIGLNPDRLSILDNKGLVNASITPSGLLRALGIKVSIQELKALSPQGLVDLVNTQVGAIGIDRLIDASIELVSDSILRADLEALRLDILSNPILKDIKLNLLATATSPGLLALASAHDNEMGSALDVRLKLGEVLGTAILIGTSERAIHIPELNILGLVQAELGIVEPPSLTVGPVSTTAYNAQVRLYVNIDSNKLLGGALSWLTDSILGIRVHLPLSVDVTTAQATFVSAQCHAFPPTATFEVDSTLLNACVGNIPDKFKWSGSARCEQHLQETELVKLLHLPILSGKTHIPGLSHTETLANLAVNPNPEIDNNGHDKYFTRVNPADLGSTVDNIVTGLLDLLGGLFRPPNRVPDGDLNYSQHAKNTVIANLATSYLEKTKKGGFYNVDDVTSLVLNGSEERHPETGEQLIPALVNEDWEIKKSIPKSWGVGAVHPTWWDDGKFSEAFKSYTSIPYGLLDVIGIPTLGKGFRSCAGLLTAGLDWNGCVEHNLTKLLQEKPGGLDISHIADDSSLFAPNDKFTCSGALCLLLKPVILVLKPILNGVGALLTLILNDILGLELGRSALAVHDINCGAPRLVSMGSAD